MNKTEKELIKYIKECNDIDNEQIENFTWEIRADVVKIKFLIDTIYKQEERIESERLMRNYYQKRAYNLEEELARIKKPFEETEENHIPGI